LYGGSDYGSPGLHCLSVCLSVCYRQQRLLYGGSDYGSPGLPSPAEPTRQRTPRRPVVKKPLNAFMLFMKEMRQKVIDECTLKESAAINQILGRKVPTCICFSTHSTTRLATTCWHCHPRLPDMLSATAHRLFVPAIHLISQQFQRIHISSRNPSVCSSLISTVLSPPSDHPRLRFKR